MNWKTFYTDFSLPVRVITPATTKEQEDEENVHPYLCGLKCVQLQGHGLKGVGMLVFLSFFLSNHTGHFPSKTPRLTKGDHNTTIISPDTQTHKNWAENRVKIAYLEI